MFGYRRHSFNQAFGMLSAIRADPTDLAPLLDLQELLISEITLAETRVRQNKQETHNAHGRSAEYFSRRSKSLQNVICYWKTFGDAITFTYLDRFALKHVYYNVHNLSPRSTAGFISGSVGFAREVDAMRLILSAGHPCVLTDLTNTIRYGDVCLLRDPDPFLIEVKSSKTKGRRATRQRANLRALTEFYQTDQLDGFRGLPRVQRLATHTKYKTHTTELNQCIQTAYDEGYAIVSPEEGIHYVAITETGTPAPQILRQVKVEEPWVFFPNEWKSEQGWAPYVPFTLLIESRRALYDFILGRLFIVVFLDSAVIRKRIAEMGYVPEIVHDSETPLRAMRTDAEGEVRISQYLVLRAALEAMSLNSIVQIGLETFQRNQPPFSS